MGWMPLVLVIVAAILLMNGWLSEKLDAEDAKKRLVVAWMLLFLATLILGETHKEYADHGPSLPDNQKVKVLDIGYPERVNEARLVLGWGDEPHYATKAIRVHVQGTVGGADLNLPKVQEGDELLAVNGELRTLDKNYQRVDWNDL